MYCPGPFYGQDQKKNVTKQLAIAYLLFEAEHTAERPAQISTKVGQAPLVRTGVVGPLQKSTVLCIARDCFAALGESYDRKSPAI